MNNDLISRSALKKEMDRPFWEKWEWEFICKSIDNAPTVPQINVFTETADEEAVVDLKAELQSVLEPERPQGEWIPVSERLPEESLNSVIGWDAYREKCVFVQYINGHFQITGNDESFNIVAWQPLPEPYKKGGKE